MEDDTVYLCKDCKFSKMDVLDTIVTLGGRMGVVSSMYRCSKAIKPAHYINDIVTGSVKINSEIPFCSIQRGNRGICGPTAKHWVPKHKERLI